MCRLAREVRNCVRTLLQSPGFTFTAIAVLALGIGTATCIFSFVYGTLLRPLPYRDADRIVVPATVFQRLGADRGSVSCPDFLDWRAQRNLFEAVALVQGRGYEWTGVGEPATVPGLVVSEDYFRVMGVQPLLGRP